jgi:hypothetical protein
MTHQSHQSRARGGAPGVLQQGREEQAGRGIGESGGEAEADSADIALWPRSRTCVAQGIDEKMVRALIMRPTTLLDAAHATRRPLASSIGLAGFPRPSRASTKYCLPLVPAPVCTVRRPRPTGQTRQCKRQVERQRCRLHPHCGEHLPTHPRGAPNHGHVVLHRRHRDAAEPGGARLLSLHADAARGAAALRVRLEHPVVRNPRDNPARAPRVRTTRARMHSHAHRDPCTTVPHVRPPRARTRPRHRTA